MNNWRFTGTALAALSFAAVMGGACAPRADDINRVQPGYVRKAIFQTDDEWHYRRTIAKSETTSSIVIEGSGDIFLERAKFKVQEDWLIAFKPYEAVDGSEIIEEADGTTNEFNGYQFEGAVLAAWPVTSHFDVQREYDTLTGRETNVISENTTDRMWHEREYMRVDFSDNVIDNSYLGTFSFGYGLPVSYFSSGSYWTNQQTRPTDPYASRFTDDYIEIADHVILGMDSFMCYVMTGGASFGFGRCGYGEAKMRHAFSKVDKTNDFVPRYYPDSIVRTDASGNAIADAETGEILREPIYNRFGFFRLDVPSYDRGYSNTETGKQFRATMFNLWAKSRDASGAVLPYADRTPKPVIYYLNAEYPPEYRQTAREVAVEYNRVFGGMIADLTGVPADQFEARYGFKDMFEVRDNDCSVSGIANFVGNKPNYLFAVERAACVGDNVCTISNTERDIVGTAENPGNVGIGNLKNVCASLESATLDPTTGKSEFTWQRIGDPRINMLVWLNNPQQSGWGGYGPMHADAKTGETISATAYIRGYAYERGAATVLDFIEFINDEKSVEDLIYAKDVRRYIAQTLASKGALENSRANPALIQRLEARMAEFGHGEAALDINEHPHEQMERLDRVNGTIAEDVLIRQEDIAMASNGTWRPGDAITDELREAASATGVLQNSLDPTMSALGQANNLMGAMGFCHLEAELDPHWAGMAIDLKDMSRDERWAFISNRMVKHVLLHELGHNVGLSHNFEGSYDALNYDDQFWDVQWSTDEEKVAANQDEFRHTTVMEYMSAKGAFSDFLGKYDEAALRFAYGEQVQVFSDPAVDGNLQGGEQLRAWRYLNDYRDIPTEICGSETCSLQDRKNVVKNRSWVTFDPQNPPENEVPYLFCDNFYNQRTPFCATFDYGSSLTEIHANHYTRWRNYYYFNSFNRDRLLPIWTAFGMATAPLQFALRNTLNVAQYFYYYNNVIEDFDQTALHTDMATTLFNGMNMVTEVIGMPEPIRMCPADPDSGVDDGYYPHYFGIVSDCDEYVDVNSPQAVARGAIQIPLGAGRPASLGWTQDYEDYGVEWVGSYFDKQNAMRYLGLRYNSLLKFNYQLDTRNYNAGLYRLFEPELNDFFIAAMQLNPGFIDPIAMENFGSYWCRDENAPGVAHLGYIEPRRMFDLETATSMPGPTQACRSTARVYPSFLANMPFSALYLSHALLSSDYDGQRNLGKRAKVYVKGADDDFTDWEQYPSCVGAAAGATCYCSVNDTQTGLEYRALRDTENGELGCLLIDDTRTSVGRLEQVVALAEEDNQWQSAIPRYRDDVRNWFERLEYARFLYRIFQY